MFEKSRVVAGPVLMAGVLLIGACGSDDDNKAPQQSASGQKQTAVQEVSETQEGLKKALAAYDPAKPAPADELVSETYLQHFEKVEGPLDKVDHELNEELEETISTKIRADIKKKVSRAQLEKLVKQTQTDLDTAKAKLQ